MRCQVRAESPRSADGREDLPCSPQCMEDPLVRPMNVRIGTSSQRVNATPTAPSRSVVDCTEREPSSSIVPSSLPLPALLLPTIPPSLPPSSSSTLLLCSFGVTVGSSSLRPDSNRRKAAVRIEAKTRHSGERCRRDFKFGSSFTFFVVSTSSVRFALYSFVQRSLPRRSHGCCSFALRPTFVPVDSATRLAC